MIKVRSDQELLEVIPSATNKKENYSSVKLVQTEGNYCGPIS
jgi:hypothetical protein